jgi:hypothetical protein
MISWIWREIRSIQLWMRSWVICFVQHSVHVLMTAARILEASDRVIFLFIQNQHDSIIFRSDKLFDHKRRSTSAFTNTRFWCLKTWLRTLSSWTMMLSRFFMYSFANESNLSSKMICLINQLVFIWISDDAPHEKAMSSHLKKRWGLIWKSDEAPFEKAMRPHLKKRWGPIWKSDGASFEKAMGPYLKKRWGLIWKSDEASFEKAMSSHLKKHAPSFAPPICLSHLPLIWKSDGSSFKKACPPHLKKHDSPHLKKHVSPHLKKHVLSHLNEKTHLLIAISVNVIFLFANNFFMTFVSSSCEFSTLWISQSHLLRFLLIFTVSS